MVLVWGFLIYCINYLLQSLEYLMGTEPLEKHCWNQTRSSVGFIKKGLEAIKCSGYKSASWRQTGLGAKAGTDNSVSLSFYILPLRGAIIISLLHWIWGWPEMIHADFLVQCLMLNKHSKIINTGWIMRVAICRQNGKMWAKEEK